MNEIKAHNTMSPEEQNIAIFESLGWKYLPPVKRDSSFIVRPENLPRWKKGRKIAYKGDIPSYGTDLNAMHEAEKVLVKMPEKRITYAHYLMNDTCKDWAAFHATAAQRARAFLKTIGKWEVQHES